MTTIIPHRPARLRFGDNSFQIVEQGAYVTCAVTGRQIAIEDLRYWNVGLQEAYADAEAAEQRSRQLETQPG
jgi:hypothetical protein